jgi:membrane protein DedA with SNARE-associated domain
VLGCKETFVVAILGAAVGDQMWYFLGKYYGQKVLARFPSLDKQLAKFQNSLTNKADILALSSRFIYGGAVVFPLGLGINNYLHKRFTLLDTIGVSFASFAGLLLGYILSDSFERLLGDVSRVEHLMLLIIVAVAAFKIYKYRKNRKGERNEAN